MNETEITELLGRAKKVFLLEPEYKRKYIPLGLAKIAAMKTTWQYGRRYCGERADVVCITSLFTYDLKSVRAAIEQVRFYDAKVPILVGGVCASLLPKEFADCDVFVGYSQILDQQVPIYDYDWGIDSPWDRYSFTFTSRGCANKCPYCAVWRIEPDQWVVPNWREHIVDIKPWAMISDNNLSACPETHIANVIRYLRDKKKRVTFDNGLDCKLITPELAADLATLKYARAGLRLAFDRIEEDGVFQRAVQCLLDAGVAKSNVMAYCLFNFKDTYQEANYRMRECVKLGIRPYPQQYQPLVWKSRKHSYVGPHWTATLLRAFRYFWLMAGFYTKMTFTEFLRNKKGERYELTDEDYVLMADSQRPEPRLRIRQGPSSGLGRDRPAIGSERLADATGKRIQGPEPEGSALSIRPPDEHGRTLWPARPGQPQYDWEEPRVVVGNRTNRIKSMADSSNGRRGGAISKRNKGSDTGEEYGGCNAIKSFASRTQGQAQSELGRTVDGTANRVDRLRLLGNGVVPQQAEKAFRYLMKIIHE